MASAVRAITGGCKRPSSWRMRRVASSPSISGIRKSISTRSGESSCTLSSGTSAVCATFDLVALVAEVAADGRDVGLVILGEQDQLPRARGFDRSHAARRWLAHVQGGAGAQREAQAEAAADADGALHADLAAEQHRELAHEREPEPGAIVLAREPAIDLDERQEDTLAVLRLDADAGVPDFHA